MKSFTILGILMLSVFAALGQINALQVETYYISDNQDATDTTGGNLESGSVTYRIYVSLPVTSRIRRIYGDAGHPLKFSSSEFFFNNIADGQSFANNISKNRYSENTVALDSWLTIGQSTKTATQTYFGVPKNLDPDSSFIGGINNDGGSAMITEGLLNNNSPEINIPITVHDGMTVGNDIPQNWGSYGIKDDITGIDSTIFGSVIPKKEFISYNAALFNSGTTGPLADTNIVLLAQLTTKGTIQFEINLEIEEQVNGITVVRKYVANDSIINDDELLSPLLKYPPQCGCLDPLYLEYNPANSCSNSDSCQTLIVLGCSDPEACNYDPLVNFNLPELCCYVGYCNNMDISVVCPTLNLPDLKDTDSDLITIFPNPAYKSISIQYPNQFKGNFNFDITDITGRTIKSGLISSSNTADIEIEDLAEGYYLIRVVTPEQIQTATFIKQ